MERFFRHRNVFTILLFLLFLNSCTAKYAIANITYDPSNTETKASEKIKDDTKSEKKPVAAQDIQKSTINNLSESDPLLKDLPEITGTALPLNTEQIIGDDKFIETELKRIMQEFGEDNEEIPQVFFDEVKRYIRTFQTNSQYRKFVTASLERSGKYMPLVKSIFSKRGIPEDMSYIAFIESGFNQKALSHAGALGLWQFMPQTARNYSLRVSRTIDERLDPIKSTYAAVDYFHDLIAIFGPRSFLLAMAAYNSGEWKIINCLKGIDDPFEERNFWHIRPCLSQETREYPPKIIASAIIGNSPEAFGFPRYEPDSNEIIDPVILADYRPEESEIRSVEESKAVNTKTIKVGKTVAVEKSIKQKNKVKKQNPVIYTVKKGNTLPLIAEAFGVDIRDMKKWNKLKGNSLSPGAKLKIYPKNPVEMLRYSVKKGDTITEISKSFHVRPKHIVICNGLKNGWNIMTGQTLVLYKGVEKKPIIYVVKKGTNLKLISDKFDVKVKNIMIWNNLSSTTLYPGQKLKIYRKIVHDA
jgi:membrane-bound lytic murein transglycosylase D